MTLTGGQASSHGVVTLRLMRVDLHPDTQPGSIAFVIECDLMRFGGTKSSIGSTLWVPVQIAHRNSAQLLALGGWLRFAGEEHVDRGADPFSALASAIDCAAEVCGFTSDPLHNGLDSAERINAEFALAIVTSLYTYFARVPLAMADAVQ